MAGQNNMSEMPAVRNESHQKTFWYSLKSSFNYLQAYMFGIFRTFLTNTS